MTTFSVQFLCASVRRRRIRATLRTILEGALALGEKTNRIRLTL